MFDARVTEEETVVWMRGKMRRTISYIIEFSVLSNPEYLFLYLLGDCLVGY